MVSKKSGCIFFIIYLYLLYSLWLLSLNSLLVYSLAIMSILIYMAFNKRKININTRSLFVSLVLIVLVLFSIVINNEGIILDVSTFFQIFISFLITCCFTQKEFEKGYSDAIYIIAIFSLVGFMLQLIRPNILNYFPYITTNKWIGDVGNMNLRNLFISVANLSTNYPRNWGIFYEPGMFAFFINVAIFINLIKENSYNIKKLIVLTLTQITTMSTNGLVSLIFIYILFFFKRRKLKKVVITNDRKINQKNMKKKIALVFFAFLILTLLFFLVNPDRWLFFYGKIEEIINGKNGASRVGSGFDRIEAVRMAIYAISLNPIFGLGITGVSKVAMGKIMTFTPLQWIATYGLLYGLICNYGFLSYGQDKKEQWYINLLSCLSLFSMIITQNLTTNGIVLSIIIYRCSKKISIKEDYK